MVLTVRVLTAVTFILLYKHIFFIWGWHMAMGGGLEDNTLSTMDHHIQAGSKHFKKMTDGNGKKNKKKI